MSNYDCDENYIIIKCNSDGKNKIPSKKRKTKFLAWVILHENNKPYPQVCLGKCLYNIQII